MPDQHDRKLSIRDVNVANDQIIKDVSALLKLEKKQVTEIIKFMGEFIAGVIQNGKMETVMLPGFGKFKPRASEINKFRKSMLQKTSGMAPMYKALSGKLDQELQEKNTQDSTEIHKITIEDTQETSKTDETV